MILQNAQLGTAQFSTVLFSDISRIQYFNAPRAMMENASGNNGKLSHMNWSALQLYLEHIIFQLFKLVFHQTIDMRITTSIVYQRLPDLQSKSWMQIPCEIVEARSIYTRSESLERKLCQLLTELFTWDFSNKLRS